MRTTLLAWFTVALCACSSDAADSSLQAGSDAAVEAGGNGGASSQDAKGEAGSFITPGDGSGYVSDVVLKDGGWFDCQGCACDGLTHFCLFYEMHFRTNPPDDAAVCETPEAGDGCLPLPTECGGTPSCACLSSYGCVCSDDGGGLLVDCWLG